MRLKISNSISDLEQPTQEVDFYRCMLCNIQLQIIKQHGQILYFLYQVHVCELEIYRKYLFYLPFQRYNIYQNLQSNVINI